KFQTRTTFAGSPRLTVATSSPVGEETTSILAPRSTCRQRIVPIRAMASGGRGSPARSRRGSFDAAGAIKPSPPSRIKTMGRKRLAMTSLETIALELPTKYGLVAVHLTWGKVTISIQAEILGLPCE